MLSSDDHLILFMTEEFKCFGWKCDENSIRFYKTQELGCKSVCQWHDNTLELGRDYIEISKDEFICAKILNERSRRRSL